MSIPISLILDKAMLENVTLTTLPVALKSVLMRSPLVELVTTESVNLGWLKHDTMYS